MRLFWGFCDGTGLPEETADFMIIVPFLVLGGAALYFMSEEERAKLLRALVDLARRVAGVAHAHAVQRRTTEPDTTPRPWPIVTVLLAAATIAAYVWVMVAPAHPDGGDVLVAYGANFGPRTANGEWWRLATATFLHAGLLSLLINVTALVQVSLVLERVVGRAAVLAVYMSAGVLAGLVMVSTRPVDVTVGASGAIFGLYGLLLTSWMWTLIHQATGVRLAVVTKLAPVAGVFVLYNAFTGDLDANAEAASLVTGFFSGLLLARGVHLRKPPAVRVGVAVAATVLVALVSAVPLRGLTDIRPRVARLVSAEQSTAAVYERHVARFREGHINATALSDVIERQILPELQSAGAPLSDLRGVPGEHEPLGIAAQEFFRIRAGSWRLRVRGLRKGSMPVLLDADNAERDALELFRTLGVTPD